MNNQTEAIANAVRIIQKNLPPKEDLKNSKISEALKSIYKSVDYIKGYFEAPAFSIFQYGFRYSPEHIERMCKIVQGFDKLKTLDKRHQAIFLVYYRNESVAVLNKILFEYADMNNTEIQNNINGLTLSDDQKKELKLVKSNLYSVYIFPLILFALSEFVELPDAWKIHPSSLINYVQEYQAPLQTEPLPQTVQTPIQMNDTQSEKTKQSKDLESLQSKQQSGK